MGRRWLGGFKRLEGALLSQEMAYVIWRASMRMREEIVMRRRRDVTRIRVFLDLLTLEQEELAAEVVCA